MSKAQRRVGKLKPRICANPRLLIKVFVVGETYTAPCQLADDKKKTPCFCVLEQGVFVFSPTPVFRIQTRVLRMSHGSDQRVPQATSPASL